MSLKARIEAVIYAAEEPVTLAALASLFRDEALALRAQRQATEAPEEPAMSAELSLPIAGEPGGHTPEPAQETPPAEQAEREAPNAGREVLAQRAAARDEIRRLVDELKSDYASADRGLEIREVAGGFRMATRPEYHDAVRAFIKTLKPPMKLSLQALETLAVIAYKQPVTAPEIGEIRGVDTSGVLGSLIARKLIITAGRKPVIGRPILYKTTREFLLRFGLKDLNELPSMEEFEKMAGELAEAEDEAVAPPAEEELLFAEDEAADQAADELRAAEATESATSEEDEREAPLAGREVLPEESQP